MIQTKTSFRVAIGLLGIIVLASTAPPVNAIEDTTDQQEPTPTTTTGTTTEEKRAAELQRRKEALEKKKLELQRKEQVRKEQRVKKCEAKAEGVNNALTKITENRRRIYSRLTEISDKVQAFVVTKQLSVENYDTLVAAVNERKAAAEASIDQVSAVSTFSCSDEHSAKDQLGTFREKHKGSINALKEYRTALKKLILAVKASIESHKGLEGRSQSNEQKPTATGDNQ